MIYRVFALLRPRNIRIRYVLLKSICQFVAPVRVSLTLISQNAGIYSVLLSPIWLFVAPVRVSVTLICRKRGIYSVLLRSISLIEASGRLDCCVLRWFVAWIGFFIVFYSGLAGRLVRKRCFWLAGGFERIPEGFLKGLQGVF